MAIIFGLDFGTTNSLVSLIDGGRILSLKNEETEAPHPSMVIARGQEIVCGQLAKEQANDEYSNAGGDVVRSPKIHLGQDDNTYPIPGRKDLHRIDLVSEVLSFLKQDAASRSGNFAVEKAVFTVPVSFDGKSRQELREAAAKAGIEVAYFDMLPGDPSFDEVKKVVVTEKRRPLVPNRWYRDEVSGTF